MNSKIKGNSEGRMPQDIDAPEEDLIQDVLSRELVAVGSVKNLDREIQENIDSNNNRL